MGYRTYIAIVDKKVLNKLRKCKTRDDMVNLYKECGWKYSDYEDEPPYCPPYNIPHIAEYEFGKEAYSTIEEHSKPLFKPTIEEDLGWEEYCFRYGKDDMILEAIKEYKQKIVNYYENLINNTYTNYNGDKITMLRGDTDEETQSLHYKYILDELKFYFNCWKSGDIVDPKNINKSSIFLTGSWFYEYAIFNLVSMYKHFNPKKHYVIYYEW